ncbi:2-C-methyl-D-erythritol 2,4-cyclodiphosphate synthase [Microbacterium faecale]|uniref:2-C-methyl-D-erythritol 2,4-cyclodiphosphate synthase n=1 Tax=Microbacterium faecale TaxID=1804630 RepID=UPI001665B5B7|nr:2-C-methyl-D-erythritol 2,4-cyclodiphosphate synthase [Microbacterium faecale]
MCTVSIARIDTAIVIVAAGSGARLGAGAPKAFVGIDESPILRHCLDGVFAAAPAQVIVVAPEEYLGEALSIAHAAADDADRRAADPRDVAPSPQHAGPAAVVSEQRRDLVTVVAGGATRQSSVAAGLARVWPDVDLVLVHDAARALTPPEVIDRVAERVRETGHGVIAAVDVIDTIKRVDGSRIAAAVDRSELATAQTPQGFRRDVLDTAYERATEEFTDDAALVADAGHDVLRVEGSALAFKITTAADLTRARDLVRRASRNSSALGDERENLETLAEFPEARRPHLPRVGVGTDVHGYGGDGSLWLAGLEWPGEPALSGHSDGDAVGHAIVDAVLNAAGLGDIGTHFGTNRPEFAGAHAEAFLAETARILADAGWQIGNVAVQLQANRPVFSPRRAEAERALSDALGAPVTVSATTTDRLGFTGRGEGVHVIATALVVPRS